MEQGSNSAQVENPRKNEKNFRLSDKALDLVERVKESRGNMSDFVSKCIEDYGPELLDDIDVTSKKKPAFSTRLKYLEEATEELVYAQLIEKWNNATIKKHQQILRDSKKKQWYNSKSLNAILNIAKKHQETRDTTRTEWQTLLRRRNEFLKLS